MSVTLVITDENGAHVSRHESRAQALRVVRVNYADGDDVPDWEEENDELLGFVATQGVSVEIIPD